MRDWQNVNQERPSLQHIAIFGRTIFGELADNVQFTLFNVKLFDTDMKSRLGISFIAQNVSTMHNSPDTSNRLSIGSHLSISFDMIDNRHLRISVS